MEVDISVVIPTHNRLEDLKKSISSILKQTLLPKEIIIIDDGSIQEVEADLFNIPGERIKLKILRNKISKGASYARNMGINEAVGKYIAFLDDDDEFLDKKLELVLRAFKKTGVDVIYHPAIVNYTKENLRYITNPKDNISFTDCLIGNQLGGASMVSAKRDMLLKLGGFDTSLPALEDYEMWMRLAKAGATFHKLSEPLVSYQVTTGKDYLSASMEKFVSSKKIIYSKYRWECSALSLGEQKTMEEANKKHEAYKNLLSGKKMSASWLYLSAFKVRFNVELLLASFFSFFGIRALILCQKLKSKV
ncbi:Glycosyltransferase, GT2 family [Modicisalibacter muralis]|uniref:Glycosyltransferase, GT2 family n=1 Tax=Modicisalibacter muralis TaxID=119000 RepID=A0A1G9EUE1_9GAMM|nr:glycosyltransferase family 2 protein [Halomonas muralis]SDK79759.1 Glycosyltransferase, GT2 family [Halomonas muralis]